MTSWLIIALAISAVTILILAIATEWRDSGPFRALTYFGWLPIWAIYDSVKEYGWSKTIKGHTKEEFAALNKQQMKP